MFIHGASSPKMPIFHDSGSLLQASYLNHKATVLFMLTLLKTQQRISSFSMSKLKKFKVCSLKTLSRLRNLKILETSKLSKLRHTEHVKHIKSEA